MLHSTLVMETGLKLYELSQKVYEKCGEYFLICIFFSPFLRLSGICLITQKEKENQPHLIKFLLNFLNLSNWK